MIENYRVLAKHIGLPNAKVVQLNVNQVMRLVRVRFYAPWTHISGGLVLKRDRLPSIKKAASQFVEPFTSH